MIIALSYAISAHRRVYHYVCNNRPIVTFKLPEQAMGHQVMGQLITFWMGNSQVNVKVKVNMDLYSALL